MPLKLNRTAYQKLIDENLEAMEKTKFAFVANDCRLEWDHIVAVLKASPTHEYGKRRNAHSLGELDRLRKYVRHIWDNERARTGRGPLPFVSFLRNVIGIEDGDKWPNEDGTIRSRQ